MVSLLVDTTSFLEAGRSAHAAAMSVERALSRAASGFAGSGHMAGSDEHGRTWASSYDEASGRVFRYTAQLHDAVATVARKLTVTGSYYELAELANAGIAEASVTLPPPVSLTSAPHIPSAAGGNRKFPNSNPAYEWVAEEISKLLGDLWPDGDTGKLDHASTVWHSLADDLSDIASSLGHIPDALAGVDTPELSKIDDQVAAVKSFAKKLSAACRTLGKACNDLAGKINYVHAQTEITLGITIAAIIATIAAAAVLTPVTFGISDVAGAGGVAAETAGAVATITGFITELATTISAGVAEVVASTAGLVGISADLAATIGVTVGDVTAGAVLWGTAGAAENTIVTAVTEPGSDLGAAAEEGFLSWGAGGAFGGILGKTVEIVGANGRSTLLAAGADSLDAEVSDAAAKGGLAPGLAPIDVDLLLKVPGTTKTISQSAFDATYQAAVHNPNAKVVMLGKFDGGGPTSYITKAGDDHTYFSLGKDWGGIKDAQGLDDDDMFNVYNKQFLRDSMAEGKTFDFSHPPKNDPGYLGRELQYLEKHGYVYDEDTMQATPK